MVDIDRHWSMVIGDLNEYAEKLRLGNIHILRRKDGDGQDFVYVCRNIPGVYEPVAPYKGYGVVATAADGSVHPHDINRLAEQIKLFLDGAGFILQLNHFHTFDNVNNFEKFSSLARDFDSIFSRAEIDDKKRVNEYLWNHIPFVFPISQALIQISSKLRRPVKAKIGIASIHESPKELIVVNFLLDSDEEHIVFQEFIDNWWNQSAAQFREDLILSYAKVWESPDTSNFI